MGFIITMKSFVWAESKQQGQDQKQLPCLLLLIVEYVDLRLLLWQSSTYSVTRSLTPTRVVHLFIYMRSALLSPKCIVTDVVLQFSKLCTETTMVPRHDDISVSLDVICVGVENEKPNLDTRARPFAQLFANHGRIRLKHIGVGSYRRNCIFFQNCF
jgi:hypothetical protein